MREFSDGRSVSKGPTREYTAPAPAQQPETQWAVLEAYDLFIAYCEATEETWRKNYDGQSAVVMSWHQAAYGWKLKRTELAHTSPEPSAQCTGPFNDAMDCPVHRKDVLRGAASEPAEPSTPHGITEIHLKSIREVIEYFWKVPDGCSDESLEREAAISMCEALAARSEGPATEEGREGE